LYICLQDMQHHFCHLFVTFTKYLLVGKLFHRSDISHYLLTL
jgi:hypothetical protein